MDIHVYKNYIEFKMMYIYNLKKRFCGIISYIYITCLPSFMETGEKKAIKLRWPNPNTYQMVTMAESNGTEKKELHIYSPQTKAPLFCNNLNLAQTHFWAH